MKTLLSLIMLFSMSAHAEEQFKTGSAEPLPELVSYLQKTYEEKIQGKDVGEVLVVGHADQRGNPEYNQKLSEKRANAAVDILIKMGLDKSKVRVAGKGETELLTHGTSYADYSKNRRVSVHVDELTRKCEENTKIVMQERPERKNVVMLGIRKDFSGLETESTTNRASVYSNKNLVPDLSYMRRKLLDSNFDAGLSIDTNTTLRAFGGYEF